MKALRHAPTAARILLGLAFTVFGANFFLHFIPQPPMAPGPAVDLAMALSSSYVMALVKTFEVIAGLMLLSNRFVPLALALLAPIVVGIVGFHLTLAPATGGAGYLVLALELYLAWAYREAFKPMLQAHVEPSRVDVHAHRPALRTAA
ncbi:MAG TPA: DoxX family protein [Polyangiales bacterium]|nr:DoxX family protein [Polyangiales bacterium]